MPFSFVQIPVLRGLIGVFGAPFVPFLMCNGENEFRVDVVEWNKLPGIRGRIMRSGANCLDVASMLSYLEEICVYRCWYR